jgi:hypothetical protein
VVEALPAFGFDPTLKTQSTRFLFQLEMGSHAAKKGRRLAQADAEALIRDHGCQGLQRGAPAPA